MPRVELQRLTGSQPDADTSWTTVLDDEGFELHLWMKLYRVQPANPIVPGGPGCNELLDQIYSVMFEPNYEFPTGAYRFVSTGVFRTAPKTDEAYRAVSDPFTVGHGTLDATVSVAGGDVEVELVYPVDPEGVRFRPRDTIGGTAEVSINGSPAGTATFDPARGALVLEGANPAPGDTVTVTSASDPSGNALRAPVSTTA
jgi:hypothetical protein